MKKLIVLIPVYKNKSGLIKTLNSLKDDAKDNFFDVLIVDDSPKPELEDSDFSSYPFKTILLVNGGNFGIVQSLNKGIEWISKRPNYLYVARLDAGDEVVNNRLSLQLKYMTENPKCLLLGGAVEYVTPEGQSLYTFHPPTNNKALQAKMHINNYICHPASMISLAAIHKVGGYREKYPAAEDYDLFLRLSDIGEIAALQNIVIKYEISSKQISARNRRHQLKSRLLLQIRHFNLICIESYVGLVKSLFAFILPWSFIIKMKARGFQV